MEYDRIPVVNEYYPSEEEILEDRAGTAIMPATWSEDDDGDGDGTRE